MNPIVDRASNIRPRPQAITSGVARRMLPTAHAGSTPIVIAHPKIRRRLPVTLVASGRSTNPSWAPT